MAKPSMIDRALSAVGLARRIGGGGVQALRDGTAPGMACDGGPSR